MNTATRTAANRLTQFTVLAATLAAALLVAPAVACDVQAAKAVKIVQLQPVTVVGKRIRIVELPRVVITAKRLTPDALMVAERASRAAGV